MLTPQRHLRRRRQTGLSLVELMVGISIGLFIVAAASLVVTTQLGDNRRLLLETQLQQDLRASADIITRELRRAGAWGSAELSIWHPGKVTPVAFNQFNDLSITNEGRSVEFEYQRGPGNQGPYGFRLTDAGVVQTLLAAGGWQDLTDGTVIRVTAMTVTPIDTEVTVLPCPRLCPDDSTDCWPTLTSRSLRVDLAATSRNDAAIARTLTTHVRPRNDAITFNGAQVCP